MKKALITVILIYDFIILQFWWIIKYPIKSIGLIFNNTIANALAIVTILKTTLTI